MAMKAHDVRHLTVCQRCGDVGDDRDMVRVGADLLHGRCAVATIGVDGLMALPKQEIAKLRLDDVGAAVMKRLIAQPCSAN